MNEAFSIVLLFILLDCVTKEKTALRQGVSCSINCILPAGKSVINVSIPLFKLRVECNATK